MNNDASPISITGAAAITCAGTDLNSFWKNALAERSGIDELGLGSISDSTLQTLSSQLSDRASLSKPALLARLAIRDAMKEAAWTSLNEDDGLIVATTVGQIPLWEKEIVQFLGKEIDAQTFGRAIVHQPLGSITDVLSKSLCFSGKSWVISSACSAATQAIGLASLLIRQGKIKRCIVGGSEVLCRLTIEGFRSLQLLSSHRSQPFDQNRQGINLSEGSAFFCLEKKSDRAIADISGSGFSTDAYHMAAPHPEGRGSFEAMSAAIRMAGLTPADIDWVHAHGTGSKANDHSEGAAIAQLFGVPSGRLGDRSIPWVSSSKWLHGHALGASGAIETALCIQALRNNLILKTPGLTVPDPLIAVKHPKTHIDTPIRHIVKNTLGFGGNNAALVISAPGSAPRSATQSATQSAKDAR